MTRPERAAAALLALASLAGCGGGGNPQEPAPVPGVLQVAGTYQIVQRAVDSTCGGGGTPIPVTGTVTHAPGTDSFVLRDTGGTTFQGTVRAGGDFAADGSFGPDSTGNTFTQRLEGRFSTAGFTARLTVDVQPQACRFTREWTATKQGPPNVIP